ncbi:MAG: hypothetical protein EOM66_06155 [Clostridia bacterium]|nr:hypothetical protein [Clostridia bacterium]
MARSQYYSPGYTPPSGVNSASSVKEYQRMLGVTADSIWGPQTQAAYDQYSAGRQQSASLSGGKWSADSGAGTDLFNSYYRAILNQISIPTTEVDIPSADAIRTQWQEALQPSLETAIARRQSASQTTKAELDADAVSRGMGSSSYISSVKERENASAQEDIGEMEAQYGATLAERIAASLQSYDQMRLAAQQSNQQAQQSAQQAALSLAGDWYSNDMARQNALSQSAANSATSVKSTKRADSGTAQVSNNLTRSDYLSYVENLSDSQRTQLFTSNQSYWKVRRDELLASLGSGSYLSLRERYIGK